MGERGLEVAARGVALQRASNGCYARRRLLVLAVAFARGFVPRAVVVAVDGQCARVSTLAFERRLRVRQRRNTVCMTGSTAAF